jgi:hypothetical protein
MVLDNELRQPPLRAIEGLQFSMIDMMLIASRELVGDSRMGTAVSFPIFPPSGFLCGNGAPLFVTYFDYLVLP